MKETISSQPFEAPAEQRSGRIRGTEQHHLTEHRLLQPQDLLEDNRSPEAQTKRDSWNENRLTNNLFLVNRCGDARGNIDEERCIDVSMIATAGPRERYINMVRFSGLKGIVNLTHHDGDTVKPGRRPEGCGGLAAKAARETEGTTPAENGIYRFVDTEIGHKDPLVQTWISAETTARMTDKPVLAATQDHIRGTIYPIAIFKGKQIISEMPATMIIQGQYDPKKIYEHGIPSLDENEIPEEFQEFLSNHEAYMQEKEDEYPDLHHRLKTQNPPYMLITTEKIPARVRYPETFREPGSFFQIHIPRAKDEQLITIEQKSINLAIEQAQYAIEHATMHHDTPGAGFSDLHAVLIESGDIGQSERIAKAFMQQEWAEKWANFPNHQVLIAESRAGRTRDIHQIS